MEKEQKVQREESINEWLEIDLMNIITSKLAFENFGTIMKSCYL